MKTMKRLLAFLLSCVMLVCCFAVTLANAATVEKVVSTDGVYTTSAGGKKKSKVTEEKVTDSDNLESDTVSTDRIAEVEDRVTDYAADRDSSLDNSNLIFYDTNPLLYLPTIAAYAGDEENKKSAAYQDTLKDLMFVVPANMGSAFTKAFARNLTKSFSRYIQEGVDYTYTVGEEVSDLPVVGTVYKGMTDLGNVAIYATTVSVNNVSNTALLILVGGVIALACVVLIPITWIALPLMFLQSRNYVTATITTLMDHLNEAV